MMFSSLLPMLAQAEAHAARQGLDIQWVAAPMQRLADELKARFDLVLCMGNSLPHLLTRRDLDAALGSFARLLHPGGSVIVHLLNYEQILSRGERIVGITGAAGREYVRFYDFLGDRVRFNLLGIHWEGAAVRHSLRSVELRPYRLRELEPALRQHGFGEVRAFGALDLAPYDPERSGVLVLEARKGP